MSWNPVVQQKIGVVGKTSKMPSYAHRLWADYETSLGNIMAEFLFVRFNGIVTVSGAPLAFSYDATRGIWTVTGTYSAALKYSFGGISVQSTGAYAVGDYDYVQVRGPNVCAMTSGAAMTAGLLFQHSTAADNKVIEVANATTADHLAGFGHLHKAQGGAGTIGVGEASFLGRF